MFRGPRHRVQLAPLHSLTTTTRLLSRRFLAVCPTPTPWHRTCSASGCGNAAVRWLCCGVGRALWPLLAISALGCSGGETLKDRDGGTSTDASGQSDAPNTAAPAHDRTIATNLLDSVRFLLEGNLAVQHDWKGDAFDPRRTAVIRGRITEMGGAPAPGARVTALSHPEYGYSLSRKDGSFDIVVNGGEPLTLVVRGEGYIEAHRLVHTEWQRYAFSQPIELVPLDDAATTITSMAPAAQVVRATAVSDGDGSRGPPW